MHLNNKLCQKRNTHLQMDNGMSYLDNGMSYPLKNFNAKALGLCPPQHFNSRAIAMWKGLAFYSQGSIYVVGSQVA